jgi:hypothetical protein
MVAIVKRAFIFTPAFLQENDRIQSSCRIFSGWRRVRLLWNFEDDVGVKAVRLAIVDIGTEPPLIQRYIGW